MPKERSLAVVGAGAAGLCAAIWAARSGLREGRVRLYDSRTKIGAKILLSGGTRCNVTHRSVKPSDYCGGAPHFIRHVLEAFTPERTREFFSELGVELALEPTGKYFPTTGKARTVLEALLRECDRLGVELVQERKITGVRPLEGGFRLEDAEGRVVRAERVILATGGLSLPETGSDGTGLKIARELGHAIVPTHPALTPLTTSEPLWKRLAGIALHVQLSLYARGRKIREVTGSLLFTHDGFSGPAPMDLSRHYLEARKEGTPEVRVKFLPGVDEPALIQALQSGRQREGLKSVRHYLAAAYGLPMQLAELVCRLSGLSGDSRLKEVTTLQRKALLKNLLDRPLEIDGTLGYRKAEVTAGGVQLSEVRVGTLESKKVAGLHFAGEILDVDGRIGGFNFQWAWSSGHVAGRACAEALG